MNRVVFCFGMNTELLLGVIGPISTQNYYLTKALFTRREGNPGARITLTLTCFFFFHMTCTRQV